MVVLPKDRSMASKPQIDVRLHLHPSTSRREITKWRYDVFCSESWHWRDVIEDYKCSRLSRYRWLHSQTPTISSITNYHNTTIQTEQPKKDTLGPQSTFEEIMSAKLAFLLYACLAAAAPSLIPRQGDDGITYEQSCDDDKNPDWDDCTWTLS